jgi:hypothetical protein
VEKFPFPWFILFIPLLIPVPSSLLYQIHPCTVGWVDIGIGTKIPVPLRFVTYLSKVTKINEKSVLTQ